MPCCIILVGGGSGSGKTTLSQAIVAKFGPQRCALLGADEYFKPPTGLSPEELAEYNFDHPDAIEFSRLAEHLHHLKAGLGGVLVPRYDFTTHSRLPMAEWTTVVPKPIVVVEGILVLHPPAVRWHSDIRVFVDTPEDVRFERRAERDTTERGRSYESVFEQWRKTVLPMHRIFCEPSRQHANFVVPGEGDYELTLSALRFHPKLEKLGE